MQLSDCRFYCCGNELNFSIFSDVVCRAQYLKSIDLTLPVQGRVDVYEITPPPASRWVVVRQTQQDGFIFKWFVREGETFLEKRGEELPHPVKAEILHRFPQLAEPRVLAA